MQQDETAAVAYSDFFSRNMKKNESHSSESTGTGSSIPHPTKLLIGPSSQLRAPSSLLSSSLPPTLLQEEENNDFFSATNNPVAMRPRRLWTIQDTALKRVPQGYPPLNPNCIAYVGDASPSVVAVRISECFRKRSIAVEYDDETVRSPPIHPIAETITCWECSFHSLLLLFFPLFCDVE